jgi:hypothetical protein
MVSRQIVIHVGPTYTPMAPCPSSCPHLASSHPRYTPPLMPMLIALHSPEIQALQRHQQLEGSREGGGTVGAEVVSAAIKADAR